MEMVVLLHAKQAMKRDRCIVPTILDPGARKGWTFKATFLFIYPRERDSVPILPSFKTYTNFLFTSVSYVCPLGITKEHFII